MSSTSLVLGQIIYDPKVSEKGKIEIENYHTQLTKLLNENPQKGLELADKAVEYALSQNDFCNVGSFLATKATCYIYMSEYKKAKKEIAKADEMALKCRKPSYIYYKTCSSKYFIESDMGNIRSADSLLNVMLYHATNLEDTMKIAYANANKGSFLSTQGKSNSAIECFLTSIEMMSSKRDTNFLINVYGALTGCYLNLKNYSKSLEIADLGLSLTENMPTHIGRIVLLNNKGATLNNLGNLEMSKKIFTESILICRKIESPLSLSYALHGLGECYLKENNYALAEKYINEALDIELKNEYKLEQINSFRSLAEIYLDKNDFQLADENIEKAMSLVKLHDVKDELVEIYGFKTKLYLKQTSTIEFNNYISNEKTRDSLFNTKQSLINEDVSEKYKSYQKDVENKKLLTEKLLKEATISAQRNYLIGGSLGLLLVSLLSFFLYRQKEKQQLLNKSISHQKDQIQLLNRELNHRVKNNLAFMTSLLEMQGRRTDSAEAKQVLAESETRLKALALVHSQLFRSENDVDINLKTYLSEVLEHLKNIFSISNKQLDIQTNLIDFQVNAEDAMRLGLIINESVTNSVKHAFHEVTNPLISIKTSMNNDGKLVMDYQDNGPGLETILQKEGLSNSLGLKLISLLKKQLGDRYVVIV